MPDDTLVIHAHPRPNQSQVTARLLSVLSQRPGVSVRSLYALYPDFDIDVAAEQSALLQARLVIWLCPVHWYSVPALLKHWFDQVLTHGWAYGHGASALRGKTAWWVTSAGAAPSAYTAEGAHGRPFADFVPPIEHTARFCGMNWLPPLVVHAGHSASADTRDSTDAELIQRFESHRAQLPTAPQPLTAPQENAA